MRRSAQLLALALALGAPTAEAVDLDVRVNTITKYEDSTGRESGDRDPQDVSFKIGPDIRLRATQAGKLDYDFSYRPEFEYFFTNRDFNDEQVDHFVTARFSYRLTGRTTIFGNDVFSLVNNPRRTADETPADDLGEPDISLRNEQNIFNTLNLGLRHVFTPRISGTLSLASSLRTSENERQSDSSSLSGGANLNYGFSSRSSVGFGFNASRQDFEESEARGAGGSTSFRLFGSYSHLFSPTLRFSASAGPLWIEPDNAETSSVVIEGLRFVTRGEADAINDMEERSPVTLLAAASSCVPIGSGLFRAPCRATGGIVADDVSDLATGSQPLFVDRAIFDANQRMDALSLAAADRQENQGSISLFLNMSLNKSWEHSTLGFTLSRDEANSIGDGISAVTTRGVVNWFWEPGERWQIRASFAYSVRESTADTFRNVRLLQASTIPGLVGIAETAPPGLTSIVDESGSDLETMVFQARVERRLTRRLRAFMTFLWRDQSSSIEGRVLNEVEDMTATLGLVYQFPTLHF